MLCLPAHSSHILQPLDVGVYGHVKKEWRLLLQDYYFKSRAEKLDKENFAPLLKQLYGGNKVFTTLHAVAGFQNTGLFPLNKDAIDRSKLQISETFMNQQPSTPGHMATTSEQTTPVITPANNNVLLEYAKSSLELALKTHFQIQNTHTKKSKKTDLRPLFDGQIVSTEAVTEKIKQIQSAKEDKEKQNQARKATQAKKKLNFTLQQAENSINADEALTSDLHKKFNKCKSSLIDDIFLCENTACKKWFCKNCLPKRFKIGLDGNIHFWIKVNQPVSKCIKCDNTVSIQTHMYISDNSVLKPHKILINFDTG